jgi:hypothetical protein
VLALGNASADCYLAVLLIDIVSFLEPFQVFQLIRAQLRQSLVKCGGISIAVCGTRQSRTFVLDPGLGGPEVLDEGCYIILPG